MELNFLNIKMRFEKRTAKTLAIINVSFGLAADIYSLVKLCKKKIFLIDMLEFLVENQQNIMAVLEMNNC